MSNATTLTVHVYAKANFNGQPEFFVSLFTGLSADNFGPLVASAPFLFTLPPNFGSASLEIAELESMSEKALATYQRSRAEINERLEKLKGSLHYEVAA